MAIYARTNGNPSKPTNRMWSWGLVGFALTPFVPLLGAVAGGWLGYKTGLKKQENELESGVKKVKEPTLVNGGMAKGWLWGSVVGTATMVGVAAAILFATGGLAAVTGGFSALLLGGTAAPAMLFPAVAIGAVTGLATNVSMIVKGAFRRRDEMRDEYSQAMAAIQEVQQRRTQEQAPGLGQGMQPTPPLGLPEKAQAYQFDNSAMADKRADRPWTQQVNQSKPVVASGQTIA